MNRENRQDLVFIGVILFPLVVLVGILIYLPALDSLLTSFTNENLRILRTPKLIWLKNYSKLIENSEFWTVTARSFLVVALTLPLELLISLGLALLLTEAFPGRAMVRTLIILPWMLPPIVYGFFMGMAS
jgi:ABC-type sugar transport systems, permease components